MISKITPEQIRNPEGVTPSYIEKAIPFMGGRPHRDIGINADDITNLIIACNTCDSMDDLFNKT